MCHDELAMHTMPKTCRIRKVHLFVLRRQPMSSCQEDVTCTLDVLPVTVRPSFCCLSLRAHFSSATPQHRRATMARVLVIGGTRPIGRALVQQQLVPKLHGKRDTWLTCPATTCHLASRRAHARVSRKSLSIAVV